MKKYIKLMCIFLISSCVGVVHDPFYIEGLEGAQAYDAFWEEHLPRAIEGDPDSAGQIYQAIYHGGLVPPGRPVDNYENGLKSFDLAALVGISLIDIRPSEGDAPAQTHSTISKQSLYYISASGEDIFLDLFEYLGIYQSDTGIYKYNIGSQYDYSDFSICTESSDIIFYEDGWADACRAILYEDNIIPSIDQWSASFVDLN